MENLQLSAREVRRCARPGHQRTGSPDAANDNGGAAAAASAIHPRLMHPAATPRAAITSEAPAFLQSGAAPSLWRRLGRGAARCFARLAAARLTAILERWPDHRLDRAGLPRPDIRARVRDIYGLPPPRGGD